MKSAILFSIVTSLLAAGELPVAKFTDPARRQKLEKAFPEIDQLFERYMKQRGAPGLVYGIVIDGQLAHLKTFGVRDRESNDPVTSDTIFRIASMTKSFTGLAILKLRDEGKLTLDDPVAKWIPEFGKMQYPTRDTAPIRVRQLLTHGAGFPEDNPWGDQQLAASDAALTDWLKEGIPFSTAPDTEFEYSNYGFALAGRIISKASQMPYRDYVEKHILAPLGMTASTLEPSAAPPKVRATGYRRLPDGAYEIEPSLAHGAFGAMGGLLTSANDMSKYVAFMLSAWPPRDDEDRGPVRRSSVREMQRVWRTSNFSVDRVNNQPGRFQATSGGYGYGLGVTQTCSFGHMVGHGGGLPGFGSYMLWLPHHGVGMFAMANVTYAGPGGVMQDAFEVLGKTGSLEKRKLPPAPVLLSTRDAIVDLWRSWDESKANALAADNLFKDMPAKARQEQIAGLKKQAGECGPGGEVDPENWLRGRFRMKCTNGEMEVAFTLAPTKPPQVQALRFVPVMNFSDKLLAAAESAIAKEASRLGKCTLGATLSSDGRTNARVRLDCERGPAQLIFGVDGEGKLRYSNIARDPGSACAP